jgi:hypothetical protein
MKVFVRGAPHFELELTDDQLRVLTRCAESHYSAECKNAAKRGGFIFGWNNRRQLATGNVARIIAGGFPIAHPITYSASWANLDVATKCLEGAHWQHDERDQKEGRDLARLLGMLLNRTNDLTKNWRDTIDVVLPVHL